MNCQKDLFNMDLPPRLAVEEEKSLLNDFLNNGNIDARNKLVVHNLRLISEVIRREFPLIKHDKEDLFAECVAAVISAIEKYDRSKEVAIGSYLYTCVKNYILQKFIYEGRIKRKGKVLSLETTPVALSFDGEAIYIKDHIATEDNVEEEVTQKVYQEETLRQLNKLLNTINPRWKAIFEKYWGLNGQKSRPMTKIAEEEGVSYQRVSQILYSVMFAIKKDLVKEQAHEIEL